MNYRAHSFAALVGASLTSMMIGTASYGGEGGPDRRIPDEYEAVGGHAMGLGNNGVAALGGFSAVRVNPAILPLETQYSVNAGYSWPTSGRNFYQMGVVDSKTSEALAAGFSYTGFMDPYEKDRSTRTETYGDYDSPINRRATVALAHAFQKFSLGMSGQFIAAYDPNDSTGKKMVKGTGLGFGMAALLTPVLRLGASGENVVNRNIEDYSPQTLRAGLAFLTLGGNVSLHGDYRQRQRVSFELPDLPILGQPEEKPFPDQEKMVFASFSVKMYDVLRIIGAYGQAVSSDKRRTLAGGIGIVHDGFALTYDVIQPHLGFAKLHNSVNLSLMMSM